MTTGKQIQKWADESMFSAEKAVETGQGDHRPIVTLLDAPNDPLGKLAALAKAYQGSFPVDYSEITDEDRRYYITDMEKNILGSPSESVMFHFLIENVTRSYTHQLVRTRHASYQQESMRFAVKEDFPEQLPPYLLGTVSELSWWSCLHHESSVVPPMTIHISEYGVDIVNPEWQEYVDRYASEKQKARFTWDRNHEETRLAYEQLIGYGMPAEDARGRAPHSIVTKINMEIDLRSLMAMAGQRLCTQAQFEHREVWNGIIGSIRDYGYNQEYRHTITEKEMSEGGNWDDLVKPGDILTHSSHWQFELLADRFLPVCYQTGRCQFRSDFDRYCNIRDRVEANHKVGRPSSKWHLPIYPEGQVPDLDAERQGVFRGAIVQPIGKHEWLNPNAAIRPDAEWRSDEALANIKNRRR